MNTFTLQTDGGRKKPLYMQLYTYLVKEIRDGHLKEGEKLPSKRELSAHLRISQNTIDAAYQMLVDEGYVYAAPRSGFYICKLDPPLAKAPAADLGKKKGTPASAQTFRYDFSTNTVDTQAFPYVTWSKIAKDVMYHNPGLLSHGHPQGDECLRHALGKYLHEFRGIHCTPEQIIIGAGIEYLLGLITEILGSDRVYALENPGYFKTYHIIRNNGGAIRCIGLDAGGILLEELNASQADVVYITPSHQFPMGTVMPIGRRLEILRWANDGADRYVIEDDYDSEFRFNGRPIPALQGLDDMGRVIYIGTFSRSIAPSIRIAYMVLPQTLLEIYKRDFSFYSSTVSRFEQHTLARFIEGGHFGRHVNRMRNIYKKRKETLVAALKSAPVGAYLEIIGENAGLHFLLRIKNGMTEAQLVHSAAAQGIKIAGLSHYCLAPMAALPDNTVVLGYSGLQPQDIANAVELLSNAWA